MSKNKGIHMVTFLLLVVGGLNWLLLGLFEWEIGMLFGEANNMVAKVIYVLVGLSAIYELATHKANCKACSGKGEKMMDKPANPEPKSDMGMVEEDKMDGGDSGDMDKPGM